MNLTIDTRSATTGGGGSLQPPAQPKFPLSSPITEEISSPEHSQSGDSSQSENAPKLVGAMAGTAGRSGSGSGSVDPSSDSPLSKMEFERALYANLSQARLEGRRFGGNGSSSNGNAKQNSSRKSGIMKKSQRPTGLSLLTTFSKKNNPVITHNTNDAARSLLDLNDLKLMAREREKQRIKERTAASTKGDDSDEALSHPQQNGLRLRSSDLSPSDRPIVIGLTVPYNESTPHGERADSASSRTPATPSIVVTPAKESPPWNRSMHMDMNTSPEMLHHNYHPPRVASSVYSQPSPRLLSEDIPPVPAIPALHSMVHQNTSADYIFATPTLQQGERPLSTNTEIEVEDAVQSPRQVEVSSDDDNDKKKRYFNKLSVNTADANRHPSQGWWNLLLSPLLSRSNTLSSNRSRAGLSPKQQQPPVSATSLSPSSQRDNGIKSAVSNDESVSYWWDEKDPVVVVAEKSHFSPDSPDDQALLSRSVALDGATDTPEQQQQQQQEIDEKSDTRLVFETGLNQETQGLAAEYYQASAHDLYNKDEPYFECVNHVCSMTSARRRAEIEASLAAARDASGEVADDEKRGLAVIVFDPSADPNNPFIALLEKQIAEKEVASGGVKEVDNDDDEELCDAGMEKDALEGSRDLISLDGEDEDHREEHESVIEDAPAPLSRSVRESPGMAAARSTPIFTPPPPSEYHEPSPPLPPPSVSRGGGSSRGSGHAPMAYDREIAPVPAPAPAPAPLLPPEPMQMPMQPPMPAPSYQPETVHTPMPMPAPMPAPAPPEPACYVPEPLPEPEPEPFRYIPEPEPARYMPEPEPLRMPEAEPPRMPIPPNNQARGFDEIPHGYQWELVPIGQDMAPPQPPQSRPVRSSPVSRAVTPPLDGSREDALRRLERLSRDYSARGRGLDLESDEEGDFHVSQPRNEVRERRIPRNDVWDSQDNSQVPPGRNEARQHEISRDNVWDSQEDLQVPPRNEARERRVPRDDEWWEPESVSQTRQERIPSPQINPRSVSPVEASREDALRRLEELSRPDATRAREIEPEQEQERDNIGRTEARRSTPQEGEWWESTSGPRNMPPQSRRTSSPPVTRRASPESITSVNDAPRSVEEAALAPVPRPAPSFHRPGPFTIRRNPSPPASSSHRVGSDEASDESDAESVLPPYTAAAAPRYRAVYPPVSPGLQQAMTGSGGIAMSEVSQPRRMDEANESRANSRTALNSSFTEEGLEAHRPGNQFVTPADLRGREENESRRRRLEKEEKIGRKVGGLWRGRACFPEHGCFGRGGPEGRKRRRWYCAIVLFCMAVIIISISLATTLTHKGDSTPVQSEWLNLTGYPPIPTGIMTVAGPAPAVERTSCITPSEAWSCALPKEQQASNAGGYAADFPNFRFEIRFRNGTNATATSSATSTATAVSNSTAAVSRRSLYGLLYGRDGTWDPSPAAPRLVDQIFLGNTTDNITSPFQGEDTPFYITILSPIDTDTSNAKVKRDDSTSTSSTSTSSASSGANTGSATGTNTDTATGTSTTPTTSATSTATNTATTTGTESTTTTDSSSASTSTSDSSDLNSNSILPAPDYASDGTAAAATLYPLPVSQPIKLYNRGLASEHYGFYTYYDRSIFLASNATITGGTTDTNLDDSDGGSTEAEAAVRCTWSQTRFLVQIWTQPQNVTHMVLAASSSSESNSTSTTTTASSTKTATSSSSSSTSSSSANDFVSPGSFPYPVTITIDRHGGVATEKLVYCYGLEQETAATSSDGTAGTYYNLTGAKLENEDRSAGGTIVDPSPDYLVLAELISEGVTADELNPVDGGTGGCMCEWRNWEVDAS